MIERIWIFSDFYVPRTATGLEEWLQWYAEMAPSDVVLGVNEEAPVQWKFRNGYGKGHFIAAAIGLIKLGIRPHIMSWIHDQDPRYAQDMMEGLMPIFDAVQEPEMSLLLDAEAHWLHKGNNEERVADAIGEVTQDLFLGTTGYSGIHKMEPRYHHLREVSDYVIPQAYSNYTVKQPWTTSWWWRPGVCQKKAYENWADDTTEVIMGLGAWDQHRPGHSAEEGMREAYQTCERLGITEVAYWSRKHLKRNAYGVGDFVRRQIERLP